MSIVKQYGNYVEVECCKECDYALEDASEFYFAPAPNVCPKCGGKTEFTVGRWIYSEKPVPWLLHFFAGYVPETVYHGFERGRERDINHKKLVVEPCDCANDLQIIVKFDDGKIKYERGECDCDGCKISDNGTGYQPCHNRKELSAPPEEVS